MAPEQPQGAPAAGGKLASKVGGPKNLALIGAAGTVALVGLIAMRKNSSSAATSTDTTDTSAYDSSQSDMWAQWQSQFEDLQEQINSGGGTTTAGGGSSTPPVPLPVPVVKPPTPAPAPTPAPPPAIPKPPTVTPPKKKVYVVKKGDTLSGIAKKNGISMATLKKLNPVYWTNKKYKNGNLIWAGDKVVI